MRNRNLKTKITVSLCVPSASTLHVPTVKMEVGTFKIVKLFYCFQFVHTRVVFKFIFFSPQTKYRECYQLIVKQKTVFSRKPASGCQVVWMRSRGRAIKMNITFFFFKAAALFIIKEIFWGKNWEYGSDIFFTLPRGKFLGVQELDDSDSVRSKATLKLRIVFVGRYLVQLIKTGRLPLCHGVLLSSFSFVLLGASLFNKFFQGTSK